MDEGLSHHDRVILEGIADGISRWYTQHNPLVGIPIPTRPPKEELDWLLDRLTYTLHNRIPGFDSKKFVEFVWQECGL
jgi:hypothetical protein